MECGAKFGAEGGEGEHGFKEDIRYLISDIRRRGSISGQGLFWG